MQHFVKLPDIEYYIDECLGWPLKADLTMRKKGGSKQYRQGDYTLLYKNKTGALQLGFMTKAEFESIFQAAPVTESEVVTQDGTDNTLLGSVEAQFNPPVDPFRPAREPVTHVKEQPVAQPAIRRSTPVQPRQRLGGDRQQATQPPVRERLPARPETEEFGEQDETGV